MTRFPSNNKNHAQRLTLFIKQDYDRAVLSWRGSSDVDLDLVVYQMAGDTVECAVEDGSGRRDECGVAELERVHHLYHTWT